jgi:hypothetical protein
MGTMRDKIKGKTMQVERKLTGDKVCTADGCC